jgi:tetratricopeptide (TPR) repeat protein
MRRRPTPTGSPRAMRPRRTRTRIVAGALLLAVGLAGCSGLMTRTARSYAIAPSGLDVWEDALRRSLAAGQFEDAWRRSASEEAGGPGDRLLRALYAGAAAHYAGRYAESAEALERAGEIADERYTRSASKGALALVTNDRALAYVPGQTERAMVHYYALLDYLALDDVEGAAVEARRLSALLQRYVDGGRDPLDASTRAVLRYLAGVAFEAAGNPGDAGVAYRNARLLLAEARLPMAGLRWPDSLPASAADGAFGDVVVVVEQGFVAHRVDQSLHVRLGDADGRRLAAAGDRGEDVQRVVSRVVSSLTGEADGGLYADARVREIRLLDDDAPRDTPETAETAETAESVHEAIAAATSPRRTAALLKLAWPAYRRPAASLVPVRVASSADTTAMPLALRGDLSDAVVADFKRDRARLLSRLLVRAAARHALTQQVGRKHSELGDIFASVTGSVLERADTRSWHLLPGTISVVRLRMPVGRHTIRLDAGGAALATGAADDARTIGEVDVHAGRVTVLSTRIWPGDAATRPMRAP